MQLGIAVLLAVLAAAPTAHAWTPPGDRPATSPLVTEAVAIGENYWTQHGMHACPVDALDVRVATDLSDGMAWQAAYGRGELGGCRIWLLDSLVKDAQSHSPGNEWAEYLCRATTNELGHTAGLDDDYGSNGVMDPAAEYRQGTPSGCRAWAAAQRHMFKMGRAHARASTRARYARPRAPIAFPRRSR
jgi:hypothetical protein